MLVVHAPEQVRPHPELGQVKDGFTKKQVVSLFTEGFVVKHQRLVLPQALLEHPHELFVALKHAQQVFPQRLAVLKVCLGKHDYGVHLRPQVFREVHDVLHAV